VVGGLARLSVIQPSVGARQSLVDVAYAALRDAITSGELLPGTRLREAELAGQLGVSTTPVREALRRLDREGLVHLAPNRGARVVEYSLRDILDRFEVREVLECHAVGRAARSSVRDLRRARALLTELNGLIDEWDRIEWNHLELAFHRAVNDLSGNPVLAALAESTHREVQGICVRYLRAPILRRESFKRLQAHHRLILAAIKAGDPDAAVQHARAHIQFIRDSISDALRSEGAA
jgi:DNA-binding GntR family transcriptional regulator